MLDGKRIYRAACNQKIAWDAPLPEAIVLQWTRWENQLPAFVSTRRSIATFQEPIQEIQLHAFGDASGYGVRAAVYAVVTQKIWNNARLSKVSPRQAGINNPPSRARIGSHDRQFSSKRPQSAGGFPSYHQHPMLARQYGGPLLA